MKLQQIEVNVSFGFRNPKTNPERNLEDDTFSSIKSNLRDLHVSRTLQSGLNGGLEHLKIETRLIDERVPSVMCECVI